MVQTHSTTPERAFNKVAAARLLYALLILVLVVTSACSVVSLNAKLKSETTLQQHRRHAELVLSYWVDEVPMAKLKPQVIFAAWSDGMVVFRNDRMIKFGFVTSTEIELLMDKVEKAGIFDPALPYGLVHPDGGSTILWANHHGRCMRLCFHGERDAARNYTPNSIPSRQQVQSFIEMWEKVVLAIRSVRPEKAKNWHKNRDLSYPEFDPLTLPDD